jgi:hypothetical protein
VLALGGLFSIFIFFNLFAGFLTNALGYGLPAYFSIQALESPSSGDDVQWLTYWTVVRNNYLPSQHFSLRELNPVPFANLYFF